MRPFAPLLVLPLVAGLCACASTSLEDFDRLARTGPARTIALERDFSLYSPFDVIATRPWLNQVEEELAAVAALLEVDPAAQRERDGALIVELREVEGLKPAVTVEEGGIRIAPAAGPHPMHGIEGFAGGRRVVVLVEAERTLVLDDGRELRGTWDAQEFRSTLRHELAHALANADGIAGEAWLDEGVAMLVEHTRATEGGVEVAPLVLRYARREARRDPTLADVLVLHEDVEGIADGRIPADKSWRPRLLAFFAFLLERERARGGDVRSTIDGAREAGRAELLPLEDAWRAWLELGPLDGDDGSGKAEPARPDAG